MQLQAIGKITTPWQTNFGVPRQPGLVPAAVSILRLEPAYSDALWIEGLEQFSHLWLIFAFDVPQHQLRKRVRPPRLGGNRRLGVFATRSPYRPNPLGLSVVSYHGHFFEDGQLCLQLGSCDLTNNTLIYDIKPYVGYVDCINEASSGFASDPPKTLQVSWNCQAPQLSAMQRAVVEQTLALDPRPAYHDDPERRYAMNMWDLEIIFCIKPGLVQINAVQAAQDLPQHSDRGNLQPS